MLRHHALLDAMRRSSLLGASDGAIIDLAAIDNDQSGELVRCRDAVVKRRQTVPHALDLGVVDAENAEHRRVEGNAVVIVHRDASGDGSQNRAPGCARQFPNGKCRRLGPAIGSTPCRRSRRAQKLASYSATGAGREGRVSSTWPATHGPGLGMWAWSRPAAPGLAAR